MDDHKPDISLIDLPDTNKVPDKYLWCQCALFIEMKNDVQDSPLSNDTLNAQLPEDAKVLPGVQNCMCITAQMADNAKILMATCPFLWFSLHIAFCGTNFNTVLFD